MANLDLFTKDSKVQKTVEQALSQMDDGELFVEYREDEVLTFDDGLLRNASFNISQGFGLRGLMGERTGYGYSSILEHSALVEAAKVIEAVRKGATSEVVPLAPTTDIKGNYYLDTHPSDGIDFMHKRDMLAEIDAYIRKKDSRVSQVSCSMTASYQKVVIINKVGNLQEDIRPLTRLNITVVVNHKGRMEQGSYGLGGRDHMGTLFPKAVYLDAADKALAQALINLEAVPAPAGEMTVILGPGWPGVLLHEAVGHGLEGDFNRKGSSAFSGKVGERVAAKGVTVIDDGTIAKRRGSLNMDDEGTPTQRNILIEDGILTGYMHDRLNARLMGHKPTGNGRRESYQYMPLPRMTNTFMLGGEHQPEEMLASVDKGIFAVNFGGGQVDITSGKFVFSASEAYLVEKGKVKQPIKGVTLIGNGPDCLTKIDMIGNDMALDKGIGMCGKAGQGVPVGVGLPTLKINGLTVGGTDVA